MHIQDEDGNKMVNEYVRECKIGAGSYGKVVSSVLIVFVCLFLLLTVNVCLAFFLLLYVKQVLYRSLVDGKHYALKVQFLFLKCLAWMFWMKEKTSKISKSRNCDAAAFFTWDKL